MPLAVPPHGTEFALSNEVGVAEGGATWICMSYNEEIIEQTLTHTGSES